MKSTPPWSALLRISLAPSLVPDAPHCLTGLQSYKPNPTPAAPRYSHRIASQSPHFASAAQSHPPYHNLTDARQDNMTTRGRTIVSPRLLYHTGKDAKECASDGAGFVMPLPSFAGGAGGNNGQCSPPPSRQHSMTHNQPPVSCSPPQHPHHANIPRRQFQIATMPCHRSQQHSRFTMLPVNRATRTPVLQEWRRFRNYASW
ncbi:hypothetical protein CC80DRAFT_219100 [Byssothecium circinans]|uniref:Uncharacterized protein n=1 Tax=Byssothecium circinans TaxID=147558 RepID=A0A6A5TGK8_9PLEO|nr:hypothetical protein CC80DRAFT_219100 [Byssothecium circinans]